MASSAGGSASPRKPWESARSAATGGPSPFRPASSETISTAAVVESAGVPDSLDKTATANSMQNGSQSLMPLRSYGGVGYPVTNYNHFNNNGYSMNPSHGLNYNSYNRGYGLNSGMYGGGYGPYGGGMYGSNYASNYGGGMYGSPYGMGVGTGGPGSFPNGADDPNNPFGSVGPPSFWQSLLHKMHWMVVVFGNVAGLISENTQTFNLITTALFQFFERSGMLAGFVLKLLRMWRRPKALSKASRLALPGLQNPAKLQIEARKGLGSTWDNVWTNELTG